MPYPGRRALHAATAPAAHAATCNPSKSKTIADDGDGTLYWRRGGTVVSAPLR